jgi:hypothetical protein
VRRPRAVLVAQIRGVARPAAGRDRDHAHPPAFLGYAAGREAPDRRAAAEPRRDRRPLQHHVLVQDPCQALDVAAFEGVQTAFQLPPASGVGRLVHLLFGRRDRCARVPAGTRSSRSGTARPAANRAPRSSRSLPRAQHRLRCRVLGVVRRAGHAVAVRRQFTPIRRGELRHAPGADRHGHQRPPFRVRIEFSPDTGTDPRRAGNSSRRPAPDAESSSAEPVRFRDSWPHTEHLPGFVAAGARCGKGVTWERSLAPTAARCRLSPCLIRAAALDPPG